MSTIPKWTGFLKVVFWLLLSLESFKNNNGLLGSIAFAIFVGESQQWYAVYRPKNRNPIE